MLTGRGAARAQRRYQDSRQWPSRATLSNLPPYAHLVNTFLSLSLSLSLQGSLCSVLDDWNGQGVEEAIVGAAARTRNGLDLLDVCDAELAALGEQRAQHGRLRVGVDAGTRVALDKGGEEERRAGRWLQRGWLAQVGAREQVQHEHLVGGHAFLLHARGRDVDAVVLVGAVSDADAAARTRHPAEVVEVAAQRTDLGGGGGGEGLGVSRAGWGGRRMGASYQVCGVVGVCVALTAVVGSFVDGVGDRTV